MISLQHQYGVKGGSPSTPFWSMGEEHHFGARGCVASVNNIERFREERGWKRPHLAKLMGTSPQQVERLEKGQRKLAQEWIDKAAAAFGVEPAEIITVVPHQALVQAQRSQLPDRQATKTADGGETIPIVALDLSLSMGPGTPIEDFVESEPIEMDVGLLREITRSPYHRLRIVRGIGDSMEPKFNTGDRFLVDTTVRTLNRIDGYYWITLWGSHGLKRLRPSGPGRVLIISENKEYDPIDVAADELTIEGRAIWLARDL